MTSQQNMHPDTKQETLTRQVTKFHCASGHVYHAQQAQINFGPSELQL